MTWDNSFFISKNNLFSKQGANVEQEDNRKLLVTEVNRSTLCSACGKYVGDVSGMFYEIEQKAYCAPCGSKQVTEKPVKEEQKRTRQKQPQITM